MRFLLLFLPLLSAGAQTLNDPQFQISYSRPGDGCGDHPNRALSMVITSREVRTSHCDSALLYFELRLNETPDFAAGSG